MVRDTAGLRGGYRAEGSMRGGRDARNSRLVYLGDAFPGVLSEQLYTAEQA